MSFQGTARTTPGNPSEREKIPWRKAVGTIHIPGGTERLAAGCGPCPLHLPQREIDDELLLDMVSSFLLRREIDGLRKMVKHHFVPGDRSQLLGGSCRAHAGSPRAISNSGALCDGTLPRHSGPIAILDPLRACPRAS